ncbi:recombinase family protein [Paludisphaera borealis]|uniref:Resolvase/invertase-type recombinase catalytic domain-containing protein n=1 Tax=Paludisphaera borealis TaxID=1387353 RepID=A0A1U7CX42_9BACT|nr:recombinase family protein [Paludisphaera borealis]APW63505.1 hypothetical protein BSF38_05077 [Paludisphaera borealis]
MTDQDQSVAYVRVSTDAQDTARQYTSVRKWAEDNRITLAKIYEDTGRRHQADDRPQFQAMIAEVQAGRIQRIVIDAQDRLGFQRVFEWYHYLFIITGKGCVLVQAVDGKVLSDEDPAGFITSGIGAHTSKEEMVKKSTRDLGKKAEMAKNGIWAGGWVPYGCDVVCRTDGGEERWRVVIDGKWKRYRQWPTGEIERWDGKGENAFPRDRQPGDTLVLDRSVDERRHEILRTMFKYAADGWPYYRISQRLNEMGQSHYHPHGPWYAVLVKKILTNPASIGLPAWNKNAHGLYSELVDGAVKINPPRNKKDSSKAKTGRKRERSEWVMPAKPLFEPIVDPAVFWEVQKLLDAPKPIRTSRSEKLWLSGLVVCGKCQKTMSGWTQVDGGKETLSYVCQSFRKHGHANKFGCKLHRVRMDVLEGHLNQYLKDLGLSLTRLINAGQNDLLSTLYVEVVKDKARLGDLKEQMEYFLAEALLEIAEPEELPDDRYRFTVDTSDGPVSIVIPSEESEDHETLIHLYDWVTTAKRTRRNERIGELEAELSRLAEKWDDFAGLPTARRKVKDEMTAVEAELARVSADDTDLGEQVKDLLKNLAARMKRLDNLRWERDEGTPYARAQALRGILERMVCWFEYRQHGAQTRSHLSRVDFEPLEGDRATILTPPG